MHRLIPICSAALLLLWTPLTFAAVYNIDVSPDHKDGIYKLGEEVIFRISVREDGRTPVGKQVAYKITKDDGSQVAAGSIQTTAKPMLVKAKLDTPGVLTCMVTFVAGNMTINEAGAAAVALDQVKASLPPPDDFDAFWQSQRQLLASKPATPTSKPAKVPDRLPPAIKQAASGVIISDVEAPTIEGVAPLHAYLARPRNAKPKTLPAIIYPPSLAAHEFHGRPGTPMRTVVAVMDSDIGRAINGAKTGMLALSYNLYGVPNGQDAKAYQALAEGELKDSLTTGVADRDTHLMRAAILRQERAIDVLAADPYWNGKVLIVHGRGIGGGIGGGLALSAAGLDERVTLCIAEMPGTCDLTGPVSPDGLRWPRVGANGEEKAKQVARYFDAANFATRIKCQTVVTVNFADPAAPPASVYAAFANIPAATPKQFIRIGGSGDEAKGAAAQIDGIVRKHFIAQSATPR